MTYWLQQADYDKRSCCQGRGGVCSVKDPYDILKKPLITEKSTSLLQDNKYTFKVDPDANKTEIKQAVESIFKVKVDKVNTMLTLIHISEPTRLLSISY